MAISGTAISVTLWSIQLWCTEELHGQFCKSVSLPPTPQLPPLTPSLWISSWFLAPLSTAPMVSQRVMAQCYHWKIASWDLPSTALAEGCSDPCIPQPPHPPMVSVSQSTGRWAQQHQTCHLLRSVVWALPTSITELSSVALPLLKLQGFEERGCCP